jgi:hypothetical protein
MYSLVNKDLQKEKSYKKHMIIKNTKSVNTRRVKRSF